MADAFTLILGFLPLIPVQRDLLQRLDKRGFAVAVAIDVLRIAGGQFAF